MSESFTALPAGLVSAVAGRAADPLLGRAAQRAGVDGDSWLGRLPRTVADLCREWALTPDGPARHGMCAVALPVVGEDGPAMLKVTWPHVEAATEHLALRHWDGRGSVRLLRADPPRWALLLERLDPDRDLHGIPVDEACEIVGDLLRCLHVPAPASIPRLAEYAARRAADFTAALRAGATPVPRRFLDQARGLATELAAEPSATDRLVHTDLHYANVLAGERAGTELWLAIDPKPAAGDPAAEIAPLLHNRAAELGTGAAVRPALRRRLEIVCAAAGIDEHRARAWTIVREMDNALDLAAEPGGSDRVSLAVAIIKAMQP